MFANNKIDWGQDSKKSEDELFEKADNYLFKCLGLPKHRFNGNKEVHWGYKCQVNISGDAEWFEPTYALAYDLYHPLS